MATNDIGPRIGIDGEKQFRDSINAINAQMRALAGEMKAVTAEFAENADSEEALTAKNNVLARSVESAKSKLATLDGQLDKQRQKLTELGDALDRATAEFGENSKQAATAQNAYNKQYTTVANLERQYNAARTQLAEFENAMARMGEAAEEASQALSSQDVLAGTAGWDLIKTAVSGVTDAIREAINIGMEFDASISDLAATMGVTVDDLGELREFAQEMGATTAFTATEAGKGLNYLALAGKSIEESMEMLPQTLDLAAAGGLELATSTDMVTDAQSALGLSTEETTALIDEMAKTSTKTNTSVAQLGEGILTVGGTAKVLAGGTAEINQVLGVLADNSIKGAEGGTKLRNIILSLSAPTEAAAKELDALGVSIFDAEGNMREFSEIFPEMQKALSKLTSQQQIEALSKIFNSQDIAAAQALLGTTTERWDELAGAIDGAAGAAQQMAETRLDNLAGDITLLQSAADGAKIAFADSLNPALRDLTQLGTSVVGFVGEAVDKVPLLGQALAGLTAGVGTLAVGMTATTLATHGLTGALTAAAAAAAASPWGIAALAIGGLVTAAAAAASAVNEADDSYRRLIEDIEASRAAYEESANQLKLQTDETMAMVSAVQELAAQENKTAAEKETLLALVDDLNERVPELALHYDELNDSLSLTADEIWDIVVAQANADQLEQLIGRMTKLHTEQQTVSADLDEARQRAEQTQQAYDELIAAYDGVANAVESVEYEAVARELVDANTAVTDLEKQLAELNQEIDVSKQKYEELAQSARSAADGIDDTADSTEEAIDRFQELTDYIKGYEEGVLFATGATEMLSDALKEQEKNGTLSAETVQALIDAHYGDAIAIDEETGAVILNEAAYRELAAAQIDEQIAAAQVELWSEKNHLRMLTEQAGVDDLAKSYRGLTVEKLAEQTAGNVAALEAQIAALERAKESLNDYGNSSGSAGRSSAAASKKIKTQAEQDLATYKEIKAELDHDKAMGLVQEAEYYRRLAELRDQYLSDAENIDDYRKVSETIYKADEKALQEREKLWQTAGNNILKLEEEFQKELSSRAQEIVNSYKLFDEVPEYQKVSGQELIANLEDQINAIQGFYDNIAALEERGVDSALVADIRSMGVKASGELAGLLELTDEQLTKYSELYGEKQALANQIATEELEGLRLQTNEEIIGQLDDVAQLYDTNAPALGLLFAENLAAGMFEGMGAVEEMAELVASSAMNAFERTFNRDVEAMMTASGSRVSTGDIGELMAGFANSMTGMGAAAAPQSLNITMQTRDGIEIARAFLPDIRTADQESPISLDDQ